MPLRTGVRTIKKTGSSSLRGDVTLSQGSNVTLTQSGQDIEIAAAAGGGTPATTVTDETTFGIATAVGTSTNYAREDHTHGSPTDPVTAHVAAGDPHTQYQRESEKDAVSGYAGLDASSNVNAGEVATGSIEDNAVTNPKLRDSAGFSVIGKSTTGTGDPADIVAADETVLGRTAAGNLVFAQVATGQVANDAVTYAKMQNVSAASKLLGRGSAAGAGDPEEITLGTNLSMSGTTLNASGGGGASATTIEQDLGSTPHWRGKFTITDAAIGATSKVFAWQAPGPYTGKGTRADEAEMQPVSVVAVVPASGTAVLHWETPPMVTMSRDYARLSGLGEKKDSNAAGGTGQAVFDHYSKFWEKPKRLGKVEGNVKFSYVVFS